jgi:hypothetical protein
MLPLIFGSYGCDSLLTWQHRPVAGTLPSMIDSMYSLIHVHYRTSAGQRDNIEIFTYKNEYKSIRAVISNYIFHLLGTLSVQNGRQRKGGGWDVSLRVKVKYKDFRKREKLSFFYLLFLAFALHFSS